VEQPEFDQVLREYLEQTGMISLLSDEDTAKLEAALGAIRERLANFGQPALGNASPEQCRQWLNRLIQIFDDFTFHGNIVAPTQAHFAIVTTWWAYANRQAKAIRSLANDGMGGDAMPLARSMIEFALWSVALSQDTGPLLSTILRKSDEEEFYTLRLATGGPLEMPAEVIDLVESTPKVEGPGSPARDFSKICRSLGVGDTILITWRILSALSHPSATMAYLSTQLGPDGVRVRKTLVVPGIEQSDISHEMFAIAIPCLIWSGLAVDRMIADHPLHADLQAIAEEAQVTDLTVKRNAADG
jgi:hypothetical protein